MQFSSIFMGLSTKDTWIDFEVGKGWAALDLPKNKFVLPSHHRILVFF
jgi:hypothetical protein